jgi:hypothetical protein
MVILDESFKWGWTLRATVEPTAGTPETAAKLVRKLSTPQLLELEELVARQEAILGSASKLLQRVNTP